MKKDVLVERLRTMFPNEDNTRFNSYDIIHKFGQPRVALMYSELFWPRFREVQGMVFLEDIVEDREDEGRAQKLLQKYGDFAKVEKILNMVEVPLLFGRAAGEATEEELDFLAERLREMWTARLKICFPQRDFRVEVHPRCEDSDVAICFFQLYGVTLP